jgi:hypothetical protein
MTKSTDVGILKIGDFHVNGIPLKSIAVLKNLIYVKGYLALLQAPVRRTK